MVRLDGGRAHDDLGPVGLEHVTLVLAHLVGADEDAGVAAALGDEREPDAGVAARRLDDGAARLQQPVALGGLDHAQRDAVLDRASGVEVLDLREDRAAHPRVLDDGAELDEGGVADEVRDVLCILHRPILGAGARPLRSRARAVGDPRVTVVTHAPRARGGHAHGTGTSRTQDRPDRCLRWRRRGGRAGRHRRAVLRRAAGRGSADASHRRAAFRGTPGRRGPLRRRAGRAHPARRARRLDGRRPGRRPPARDHRRDHRQRGRRLQRPSGRGHQRRRRGGRVPRAREPARARARRDACSRRRAACSSAPTT